MRLYSTLSGVEEDFAPSGQSVKMYVCGITPYSSSHVGHAFSSVVFDVLRRYLEFKGHKVHHVQNFTDIDDKIITRSTEEGVSYRELSDKYIKEYAGEMERLRVMPAHVYPLATEAIPRMQEIICRLVEKGHAYESGGDVYFRVSGCEGYGKLSHRSIESMIAGARVVALQGKEHPMDFTLWKAAKPGEPLGRVRGGRAGRAGTSSAAPSPWNTWGKPWISTAEARTWYSLITRTRLPRANVIQAFRPSPDFGSITDC